MIDRDERERDASKVAFDAPARDAEPLASVRTRRLVAAGALLLILVAGFVPGTQPLLMVVTGVIAAAACGWAGRRAEGVDRSGWTLHAAAQLLNGIGNLAYVDGAPSWVRPEDWTIDIIFSAATLAAVVGLFAFVVPTSHAARLWRVTLDLLIVVGAWFAVAWHWGVPSELGVDLEPSAVELVRFLAVVLGCGGCLLGPMLWKSRPAGHRFAIGMAWASILVATLGDTGVVAERLSISPEMAAIAWVVSSCLLIVGSVHVPTHVHRVALLGRTRTVDVATVTVAFALLAMVVGGSAATGTQVVVAVVVLLLLVRQLRMLHTNLRLSRALKESEAHFRTLVDDTSDVIMRVSHAGVISYASRASLPVLGEAGADLIGRSLTDLVAPSDRRRMLAWLHDEQGSDQRFEVEVVPPGERRRVVSFMASRTSDGQVLSVREITRQVELRRQLEVAARWDGLTGLANRTTFDAALEKRIASSQSAAVLFCDLDRFKRINDTTGHAAGDAVLVEVARRIRDALSDDDLVARFGGDEFTVLLRPGIDADEAKNLARQIQDSVLGTYRLADDGSGIGLSISAGLAFGGCGRDASEVMRNADLALYAAKSESRGSMRVFEQSMYDDFAGRVEMEQRLREALDADGLSLAYQPVLDLNSGAVVGVEALLRWYDGDDVVLDPPAIIELAESFDSDGRVGRWVLQKAVAQAASWAHHSYPVRVSVNVSTRQLLDAALVDEVTALLSAHDLDPSLLTLEITEGAFMDESAVAATNLHRLREAGVGLAIDDFGTGYSSLAYLTRLPVGELKIDRTFVAGIPQDKDRTALVRTVIRLAHDLGLSVTAEGVERVDQLRLLRGMGAHLAQGFLISKPVTADELLGLLKRGPFMVQADDDEDALHHAAGAGPQLVD